MCTRDSWGTPALAPQTQERPSLHQVWGLNPSPGQEESGLTRWHSCPSCKSNRDYSHLLSGVSWEQLQNIPPAPYFPAATLPPQGAGFFLLPPPP